jgi:HSP20 family protein
MSILKWTSPLDDMDVLRKEIDQVFATAAQGPAAGFNPPIEITEAEDAYCVRMLLPGLPMENLSEHVHIDATQKTVTISGELQPRELQPGEKTLVSQFRTGKFFKQLSFPDGIQHEAIAASYGNGMLEIRLPKAVAAQKRSIEIQVK